jgi:phosphate-selective porin OprO/OprP
MVYDTARKKRFTWAVGFFTFGQNSEANSSKSALSVTGRVTWLPLYREDGRKLFHLGASISSRDPTGGNVRYRSRPEARFVEYFVDTGQFDSSRIGLYGFEIAAMNGPLSLQSEVIASQVSGTDYGQLTLWGGYVEVGWFLTDDHRSYDTGLGVFSKVIPSHPQEGLFHKKPGGALELTGRISNVDLDDQGLNGGQMVDYSFGVNWYLNATSAVKFNYIYSDVKDQGRANILVLRYQYRPVPVPGWR